MAAIDSKAASVMANADHGTPSGGARQALWEPRWPGFPPRPGPSSSGGRCVCVSAELLLRLASPFRRRLAGGSQFRVERGLLRLGHCRPHIKVLEAFFENFEAPCSLFRLNVNNLQGGLVIDRVSRKVTEVPYGVDCAPQTFGNSLLRITFVEEHLDLCE